MNQQENFIQNLESKLYRSVIKNHFSKIIFICIGTNQLEGDKFGPLVGKELKKRFQGKPSVEVYGTVSRPVHFLNAQKYCEALKQENACTIAIDSAFAPLERVGNTYVRWGGIQLGKAFQKELYFPANISIKTVISPQATNRIQNFHNMLQCSTKDIEEISLQVADGIHNAMKHVIL
ncbi:MAG: DUF1256 domain-containing protein [Clostridia bacterium]|nr:DUF1256 domain-containing protein [Clostridia bacterium]